MKNDDQSDKISQKLRSAFQKRFVRDEENKKIDLRLISAYVAFEFDSGSGEENKIEESSFNYFRFLWKTNAINKLATLWPILAVVA